MISFLSRLRSALRASALGLLLLGFVLNPFMAYVGDIHEMDHVSASAPTDSSSNHVDAHHHDHTAATDPDSTQDLLADVWHGLAHVGHGHGAATDNFHLAMLPAASLPHAVVYPSTAPLTPLQRIAGPFRPPII